MESRNVKIIRVILLILSVAAIGTVCMVCVYLTWEKAPETVSKDDVFTFFISGIDEQSYSTEVNLLIKLDVENKEIDVITYPRDTLLNIDFEIRKLGSIYYSAVRNAEEPWEKVNIQLTNVLGFDVGSYAFIPKTVLDEFYTDGKINDITTFFSLLNSASDTNIKDSNIAYLTRHSVDINEENIRYDSIPTKSAVIRGYSYEIILLPEWIELLNSKLNTTGEIISEENLDIVYLNEDTVCATKDLLGSWYYDSIE